MQTKLWKNYITIGSAQFSLQVKLLSGTLQGRFAGLMGSHTPP